MSNPPHYLSSLSPHSPFLPILNAHPSPLTLTPKTETMTKPKAPRVAMILAACFQNLACGGLIFGWAAISSSLLIASNEEGGPALSRDAVHRLFVMATSINFTAPLLLGILLDAYGPRICSALSILLVGSGFVLFSASIPSFPTHLPAVILIAFGGPGVQSSIIHLSNLYPASKATVTSIITGSFNLSFFIFFVFDRLWNRFHFTYQEIFAGYSIVCAVAFSFSLFLWPDQPFSFQEQMLEEIVPDQASIARVGPIRAPSVFKKTSLAPPRPGQGGLPILSSTTTHDATASAASRENTALLNPGSAAAAAMDDIKEASFWEQLRSAPFVRVTVFIVVASFWANFYIGTIDIQLADGHLLSPEKQNYMVRLFTAVTTAGVLGIPIVGGLMDRYGFVTTAAVTVSMAVIYGLGIIIAQAQGGILPLVLAFIAYALFRTFLFTYFFAYLADALGFRFFGVLAGVSFFIAGCAGLLQSPLMQFGAGNCHLTLEPLSGCDSGRWSTINFYQLACLASLYVIPLMDMWAARKADAQRKVVRGKEGGRGGEALRSTYQTVSGLKQQQPRVAAGATGGKGGRDGGGVRRSEVV